METLLNKITDAGLDPSSVSGEEAIIFWNHIRQHIATTQQEQAHCYIISSEYRAELQQNQISIDELRAALDLLTLPGDVEDILTVKTSLSSRLVEKGDYTAALNEFISSSTIAVEHGHIDEYVMAILGMGNLCDAYGDHNRALRYYQKISSIDHAISSRLLRLKFKLHMVASFLHLNRITAASDLLRECEELSILVSNKLLTAQISLYQAKVYRAQKKYHEALTLHLICSAYSNQHTGELVSYYDSFRARTLLNYHQQARLREYDSREHQQESEKLLIAGVG